jgi:pSer/pThr/pTyr-binding forkhead associated (FHA) protein
MHTLDVGAPPTRIAPALIRRGATFIPRLEMPKRIPSMTDALAGLQKEAPTQETGPLPRLGDRDRRRAQASMSRPAPGRYLAVQDGGEIVLFALGDRDGQRLRIGRSPASDILLEDPSVSRRHAVLVHRGGRAVLLDDRSLNGVFVNGARVAEASLSDGDAITIGHVSLRYVEVTGD